MSSLYLAPDELALALRTNKAIEQLVGHQDEKGYRVLEWLRLETVDRGRVAVSKFTVFDDGSDDFLDIYEFEPVNPDSVFDEPAEFESTDDAIAFATSELKADPSQFVRGGDIQLVYSNFLTKHGPPPR